MFCLLADSPDEDKIPGGLRFFERLAKFLQLLRFLNLSGENWTAL
jgi:hypothetical protein